MSYKYVPLTRKEQSWVVETIVAETDRDRRVLVVAEQVSEAGYVAYVAAGELARNRTTWLTGGNHDPATIKLSGRFAAMFCARRSVARRAADVKVDTVILCPRVVLSDEAKEVCIAACADSPLPRFIKYPTAKAA
ncbi:hypothetical protein [Gordonia malaquae]|uniref:hypothetical protein n=1 Tax=Gordonia malaquae TaxID=410332 RepID=UPI00301B03D3